MKTVLVIEDSDLNMKLVRTLLEMENYAILEAREAETGIRLARDHRPDLILMDIQLPGLDGLSATRMIKGDESLKTIPVVALTSYAMRGDEGKALEAGCEGYLTKPIDTREFLKIVAQFVEGDHAFAAPEMLEEPVDPEVLESIRSFEDDTTPDLLSGLIDTYLTEAEKLLRSLENAVARENTADILGIAHSLKSSSGNMGAGHLAALCGVLEREARSDSIRNPGEHHAKIRAEYRRVREALTRFLQESRI